VWKRKPKNEASMQQKKTDVTSSFCIFFSPGDGGGLFARNSGNNICDEEKTYKL
jgi:hypothetical protein